MQLVGEVADFGDGGWVRGALFFFLLVFFLKKRSEEVEDKGGMGCWGSSTRFAVVVSLLCLWGG